MVAARLRKQACTVANIPLICRRDTPTSPATKPKDTQVIAIIIDKYIYNQITCRDNQAKAWTQAAPDLGCKPGHTAPPTTFTKNSRILLKKHKQNTKMRFLQKKVVTLHKKLKTNRL